MYVIFLLEVVHHVDATAASSARYVPLNHQRIARVFLMIVAQQRARTLHAFCTFCKIVNVLLKQISLINTNAGHHVGECACMAYDFDV